MKRIFLFLLATILILIPTTSAFAVTLEGRRDYDYEFTPTTDTTLKVAFPEVVGFSQRKSDGTPYGLIPDFLEEIAKYTGWKYEYVTLSADVAIDGIIDNEYDLLGGQYYIDLAELPESIRDRYSKIAFPDFNVGQNKIALLALKGVDNIHGDAIEQLRGKTIGAKDTASAAIRFLVNHLNENRLTEEDYTLIRYSAEELEENDLYTRMRDGEIDLMLGNSTDLATELYLPIISLRAQSHYIVTNVANSNVLNGLNWALSKIWDSSPHFAEEVFEKNFVMSKGDELSLNAAEKEYIKNKKPVTVALPKPFHPFVHTSAIDGQAGIVAAVLEKVTAYSQLEFRYIYTDTYDEAKQLVRSGQVDLLGFFLGEDAYATENNLALTQVYTTLNDMLVKNKATTYPADNLTCGILRGTELPNDIQAKSIVEYDSLHQALDDVNKGYIDIAFGLSAHIERELQKNTFNNIISVSLYEIAHNIQFAMQRPADANLMTILNKAISNIPKAELTAIMNENMMMSGGTEMTLSDIISAHPLAFSILVVVFALILIAFSYIWAHTRTKSAILRAEVKRVEAETHAKSNFLSRMSHEIRTPINAIVGLTELLSQEEIQPPEAKDKLQKLKSSTAYLLALINDILYMSKIENNKPILSQEDFSLEYIFDESIALLADAAAEKNLNCVTEIEITHKDLKGDRIRLKQVLSNLLSNAIKFSPPNTEIFCRLFEMSSTKEDATYRFSVKDQGVGIRKEDQERIFQPFEQTGSSEAMNRGTGLGLAICWNIVCAMGGRLQVISEPDQGSEFFFTITLPLGCSRESVPDGIPKNFLAGKKLLLAEDNALNAEITQEVLCRLGAEVFVATNGEEAVTAFTQSDIDEYAAILMDIHMPKMDGLETTMTIRNLPRADAVTVPIIAMTANTFHDDRAAALSAGMNEFLSKPMDARMLNEILYRLTNKS